MVALAKKHDRAILLNKNNPTAPTMAPAAKATAQAFLADMLLILPMLGINAFTPPRQDDPSEQVQPVGSESDKFDTIVVPAREEGFNQRFLNEHCWFAVRINAKHISKLKFIAAYQVAPVAAITHIAEIDAIVPYNDTGKYMIKFKGAATAICSDPAPGKQRGQHAVVALRASRQVAGSEEPGSGVGVIVFASMPMKTGIVD